MIKKEKMWTFNESFPDPFETVSMIKKEKNVVADHFSTTVRVPVYMIKK